MIKLEVLICTHTPRLKAISADALPMVEGVQYAITCQITLPDEPSGNISSVLSQRNDIRILYNNTRGLSANRNVAFVSAQAPYLLIADDDLCFNSDGLKAIIDAFDADPALDILTLRADQPLPRVYPPDGHDLSRPWRFYSPVSFEIALRRRIVEGPQGLRFSTLAGIGAPYLGCGEEELFIHHAIRSGLRCRHSSAVVAVHPSLTTSDRSAATSQVLRAKGALMRIFRGNVAGAIRIPLEAYRAPAPWPRAFLNLVQGYIYSIKHRRRL